MKRDSVDVGRALASIVALVALFVVLPVGLVAVSRARFGSADPLAGVDLGWFGDDAASSLTRPIADDSVIDALIRLSLCAAWIAIAVIVVTTALEVVHMIRHRGLPTPSVRGLGWAQRIARFITVGLIVLIPLSNSSPSIATSLAGRMTPTLSREVAASAAGLSTAVASADHARSTPDTATTVGGASMVSHVVQPGESVYSIAEQLAGADAGSVMDIAESIVDANLDATMGPGKRFTTAAYIEAGWVLQIPAHLVTAPVIQSVEATPPTEADAYTVERGDTLWDIADEQLGDPTAWPEIWEENAGDEMGDGRTFDDPDLILPGWELEVPGADPGEVANTPADVAPVAATLDVVAPPEVVDGSGRRDRRRAITGRGDADNHSKHRPGEHRTTEHVQHHPDRPGRRRRRGEPPRTG